LKQKIKTKNKKNLLRHLQEFFFKKIYVMKCLRSKKRLNGADYTTASTSAKGAHARSAGAASTSAKEQRQGVRASASTSASGAHARR